MQVRHGALRLQLCWKSFASAASAAASAWRKAASGRATAGGAPSLTRQDSGTLEESGDDGGGGFGAAKAWVVLEKALMQPTAPSLSRPNSGELGGSPSRWSGTRANGVSPPRVPSDAAAHVAEVLTRHRGSSSEGRPDSLSVSTAPLRSPIFEGSSRAERGESAGSWGSGASMGLQAGGDERGGRGGSSVCDVSGGGVPRLAWRLGHAARLASWLDAPDSAARGQ